MYFKGHFFGNATTFILCSTRDTIFTTIYCGDRSAGQLYIFCRTEQTLSSQNIPLIMAMQDSIITVTEKTDR
jgi:hypothetical protein